MVNSVCAKDYYAAPGGSSSGNGSISRPWDLNTAINATDTIQPGDTLWLRGGKYQDPQDGRRYRVWLKGAPGKPVILRSYPGERATLVGKPDEDTIQIDGMYLWLWGLELTSSTTDRISNQSSPFPSDVPTARGVDWVGHSNVPAGEGCRVINSVIHNNTGIGVGLFSGDDIEVYGCIIYNNGWQGSDRNHGHGIYAQNVDDRRLARENIVFRNFSHGIQAFTDNGTIDNLYFEGNILFENHDRNLILGGGTISRNSKVLNNYLYSSSGSQNFQLGGNKGTQDSVFNGNFIVGGEAAFDHDQFNLTMRGNSFYVPGDVEGISTGDYPDNLWSTSLPTSGRHVVVRPNEYETGRAHIVIYNWSRAAAVSVDISNSGLKSGDRFEIRDAENFLGSPVASGTYDGSPVQIPMTGLDSAPIIGDFPELAAHSGPEFGSYVVLKTEDGSGGSSNSAPTISDIDSLATSENLSTSPIPFTINDAETSSSQLSLSGSSSNTSLAPNGNILFGGSGSNRTVTVIPALNQTGTTTITVTVSDGALSASEGFTVEVLPASPENTPPSISNISDQSVSENESTGAVSFTVNDEETANGELILSANSSNKGLVPVSNISFGGSGSSRTVQISPASDSTGSATISITVSDGEFTNTETFVLTVNAVIPTNAAPSVHAGTDQTITLPNTASLSGSASDDGLPVPPASLDIEWRKVSGPGSVSFENRFSPATTAAFSEAGTYGLRLTADDSDKQSSDEVMVTVLEDPSKDAPDPDSLVVLLLEAERGSLTAPMETSSDATGVFVSSPSRNSGSTTLGFSAPEAVAYFIWARVLAPDSISDSFFVSVDDGPEDIFDVAENKWSNEWQWSRVNGRNGGSPLDLDPRIFPLSQGGHSITFRGRETDTKLDRIVITNDPDFIPTDEELNRNPIAGNDSTERLQNDPIKIPTSYLLHNDRDPDENAINITSVSGPASNNATVRLDGHWIIYTPAAGFNDQDSFTYTLTDTFGGEDTASVTIKVATDSESLGRMINASLTERNDRTLSMLVYTVGIPGRWYQIQASDDLNNPDWQTIGSVQANANGIIEFFDPEWQEHPTRFYRLTKN